MAIITEEPEPSEQQVRQRRKSTVKPETENPTSSSPRRKSTSRTANPFHFWFYFTIFISLITLLAIIISSLTAKDPKAWFLSLPPNLRQHYYSGRTLKVQITPNRPQVEVFSTQKGSATNSDGHVLIVHGMGCSSIAFRNVVEHLGNKKVHVVAIDLPGSGFSDRSVIEDEDYVVSGLAALWDVYEEIKEKGLFWGFDQLVEQGYVNFEENEVKIKTRKKAKTVQLGSEEMGRILGQVIDTMGLNPVDLVLHDSALSLSANWILENIREVRSLVVLDAVPGKTALPLWILRTPLLREVVLGFRFVFEQVLGSCCTDLVGVTEVEAHRILLKGRDNGKAILEMGKKLNYSFDVSEWGRCNDVKDLPVQVLFSDQMISEGQKIANALPLATLVTHSGGRWIQEKNSEEVAESIYKFVSSLPKSAKHAVEENSSMPDEHGRGHADGEFITDAYGLDHGWAV